MSVQVSYKKQFVFFLILLMLFLIIIEISIRTYEYTQDTCAEWNQESGVFRNTDEDTRKQICLDLYSKSEKYDVIRLESPNQHFPTLNINSDGFRGSEISKEKPDDVYRIFVVGGSTAFGFGATSDDTTIPGYLQEMFNEQDLNIEVINAGIEGSYSTTETYYIKNTLLDYEPNLIIAYVGVNDASDVSIIDELQKTNANFDIRQILFYRTPFFLYDHFGLYADREETFSNLDENYVSDRTKFWKNHWLDLCKLSNEKDFKTIIAVQPMLGTSNKTHSPHEQMLLEKNKIELGITNSLIDNFANSLTELDKECASTMDLRNVFDDVDEPIFYDSNHMSDFGNKIIAQRIFEKSLPIVLDSIKVF